MIAEKSILGSALKANYLLKDTVLNPDHLEDSRHQFLFKTMLDLNAKNKSVDVVSLTTMVNLEHVGGISYLNDLVSFANIEKFEEYESLVIESWKEREKRNILSKSQVEDWEITKVISELDSINQSKVNDLKSINEEMSELFESPWQKAKLEKGVPTGISELDRMTNGFQNSELTVIAARPSMGKSDVLLHFAKQAGWTGHLPLIFSLEMPTRMISKRLIASTGHINRMKLHDPFHSLTEKQKNDWSNTLGKVSLTNIQVFDQASQTIAEIRSKTRKSMHQFPDKKPIIFIDYLTLIKPANFFNGNVHQQVTEISAALKGMAKEFNCPVVTLAQLNRSVEQRKDKRPMMSDIRESGSIEQDADLIMFLYREKYYDKNTDEDLLELIIAKNRNGPVGTVNTEYNEFTGEIEDVNGQRAV